DQGAPRRRLGGVDRRGPRIDSEHRRGRDVCTRRRRIVNATEQTARLQGVELFDEMTASIDERTMEILDHRRRTAVVRRRGWLVRRALLLADLLGLTAAFLLAELISGTASAGPDSVARSTEFILFVLTLPIWV